MKHSFLRLRNINISNIVLVMLILQFTTLHSEKKEKPIDFTQYELKENYYIDCPKKRECFKNCANNYVAMPGHSFDKFNTINQIKIRDCTSKCQEVICTANQN
ncbi:hypothetical protein EHQ43_01290 [Leptospira bouyouniensis]|uniref:Uncharacterized protein n=1 Tax=Leptospira bouyouniensis TaxID=2484911 RepID=A0A7I0HX60_9LEPT|nr:hypothetical protein EHQ43_01290 [Leptospira bouyouniensis]